MASKLDPNQIIKKMFNEETNSVSVDIVDTEMAVALHKSEDSVATICSTDKHVLPVVDGKCEVDVLNSEAIFVVGDDIKIKLMIADKVVNDITSEVPGQCRVDGIFAEKAIIESSSSEVTVLVR
jgi:hypothetical protein